ncbi:hypothetical protein CYMTET_20833 [Cymbomonas tetramitiformis]|uniref:Uncharacterized protein n=1 Tax=Cymbomonas tetramitiformis TaxID=36881 RepID=A0AAE0L3T8_9CHLO|nr:hypothetical protein CYMTET_20833 [Cymbomonas tetramitiformis]
MCALVGQPEVCELAAHSFVAEPSALQHFRDAAAAVAAADPPEELSLGRVTFVAIDAPPVPAVLGSVAPPAGGGIEATGVQSVDDNAPRDDVLSAPPAAKQMLPRPKLPASERPKHFDSLPPSLLAFDTEPCDLTCL